MWVRFTDKHGDTVAVQPDEVVATYADYSTTMNGGEVRIHHGSTLVLRTGGTLFVKEPPDQVLEDLGMQ